MGRKNRRVILLVLTGFCFASIANAELAITEVMSDSAHLELHSDWWELTNTGPGSVNMAGYSWDNNHQVPGTSVFWGFTIDAGESIIILDSGVPCHWRGFWELFSHEESKVYDFSGNFSGLDSADGVFLYDASDVLATSVTWSSSTAGFSHEWDISGTYLGLSVIGENGAYQSLDVNPDVGSPCYAVPEPCTIALLGIGGLALLRKRRV